MFLFCSIDFAQCQRVVGDRFTRTLPAGLKKRYPNAIEAFQEAPDALRKCVVLENSETKNRELLILEKRESKKLKEFGTLQAAHKIYSQLFEAGLVVGSDIYFAHNGHVCHYNETTNIPEVIFTPQPFQKIICHNLCYYTFDSDGKNLIINKYDLAEKKQVGSKVYEINQKLVIKDVKVVKGEFVAIVTTPDLAQTLFFDNRKDLGCRKIALEIF